MFLFSPLKITTWSVCVGGNNNNGLSYKIWHYYYLSENNKNTSKWNPDHFLPESDDSVSKPHGAKHRLRDWLLTTSSSVLSAVTNYLYSCEERACARLDCTFRWTRGCFEHPPALHQGVCVCSASHLVHKRGVTHSSLKFLKGCFIRSGFDIGAVFHILVFHIDTSHSPHSECEVSGEYVDLKSWHVIWTTLLN